MPRSRHAPALFVLLLAPAIASGQTDPALWRFVHPNAKAVINVDWHRIRQTHVGTMLREKFVDENPVSAMPGIEFLNDVDRFLISSPGRDPNDDEASQAPVLIVVRGHFDLARVRKLLVDHGARPQAFNSFQVYRPQGKNGKDLAFVLFDPQTILIGDPRSIFGSLERSAAASLPPDPNSVQARAAQMDASYDFWALITGPGALASNRLTDLLAGGELAPEARGFEIGISLRNGLAADTTVICQSDAAAKRFASELSKMLRMAVKEKVGEPAMLDLEKKLKITAEGAFVKIAVHMTQQELDKNARIFAESRAESRKQPAVSVADIRPVVKPAPAKAVIRIEGLDEGTREIPYKPERP